jgi:PBSX family phage terminase large subunit
MTGRSQSAILANCVDNEFGLINLSGGLAKMARDEKNETFVDLLGKRIDLFGGENVSSFKAFRGRSYGSAYNDEANLQHPNTIAECFNRTIAAQNRRHFMTLNPDNPTHWLYRDYLDKFRDAKTPGYRWWHFTLDDNPAISESRKAELKGQYTGFNYRRFILGERARAEGRCFESFIRNTTKDEPGNVLFKVPEDIKRITFGIDFGGHKSATVFICTGWFVNEQRKLSIVTLAYKRLDHTASEIGPKQLNNEWFAFQKACREKWRADRAFADSAEQVLIKGMNQLPLSIRVDNAMKRPINDRIRAANLMYASGRKYVMAELIVLMDAIENAIWDDKADEDVRLDDGTSDIDSLDADEYSWERHISELIGGV